MTSIILIAAPAAGKGTEAVRIQAEYNIPHISTGDLLRTAVESGDSKGKMIEKLISKGKFVSDDIVLELLKKRILQDDCNNGYILDGFPRNVLQASAYDKILSETKKDLGIVIVFDIDKQIAKSRMEGRCICPECGRIYNKNNVDMSPLVPGKCDDCKTSLIHRSDDDPETYLRRYNTYIEKTEPLIAYYEEKGNVFHVDAGYSEKETHDQVMKILEGLNDRY